MKYKLAIEGAWALSHEPLFINLGQPSYLWNRWR